VYSVEPDTPPGLRDERDATASNREEFMLGVVIACDPASHSAVHTKGQLAHTDPHLSPCMYSGPPYPWFYFHSLSCPRLNVA
jgi:hypothetical protein